MGNFYEDVIQRDSRYLSLNRIDDPALLWPKFRALCEAFAQDAAAIGHHLLLLETYRSNPRQIMLFHQGHTEIKTDGTHHFGVAADYVVVTTRGTIDWMSADYDFYRGLALKYKIVWGRDWGEPQKRHTIVDSVHLQVCTLADEKRLLAGWYPPDDYVPSEFG